MREKIRKTIGACVGVILGLLILALLVSLFFFLASQDLEDVNFGAKVVYAQEIA